MNEIVFCTLKHGIALAAALIVAKYAMDGMNSDSETITVVLISIVGVIIGQWVINLAQYLKTKLEVNK